MMSSTFRLISAAVALLAIFAPAAFAPAQEVISPPQGKGHVVVFIAGLAGPQHDKALAEDIALRGYVVAVFDGRKMGAGSGQALETAILSAQKTPNALPGKVALVGVSLGGGFALAYGSKWPELVAVDIVWYPATGFVKRAHGFGGQIKVPVLMFAGESDHFLDCCLITTARLLEADAKAANAPFELVTYPGAQHDFIKGGSNFNPAAYGDALEHTAAKLKAAFGG
jgi:dienelactone hydrolase